jgi:phosphoglycerate dehydrogenase-like enzyme
LPCLLVYSRSATKVVQLLEQAGFEGEIVACTTPEEARPHLPKADLLLVARMPADLYPLATQVSWIQSMNAGVDDLVAAPLPKGIPVTRVEGIFGGYIAEWTIGWILHHTLDMRRVQQQQAAHKWEHYYIDRVAGKRIGLAGLGSIGKEVANRAKALGATLVGLSHSGRPFGGIETVFSRDRMDEFVRDLDILAITLPLTAETRGLFGKEQFDRMKRGALVLNAGRGAVCRETDLIAALQSGQVGNAVLDVFDTEPLPAEHPFWAMPNVVVTPHIAGPTTAQDIVAYFLDNYARLQANLSLRGTFFPGRGY